MVILLKIKLFNINLLYLFVVFNNFILVDSILFGYIGEYV